MKRIFLFHIACYLSLVTSLAQPVKPCGTSVLTRHRVATVQEARSLLPAATWGSQDGNSYKGEKKGLIILVEFPNQHFKDDSPRQIWTAIANEEGYSKHSARGSVSDYFHDQSYGQFHLSFDVVGPVEAAHDYAYYGDNIDFGGLWFDQNVGELMEEACRGVSDSVQFANYDWDGDGEVEQVFMVYAGHGENDYWSKDSTVIWPHMGMLVEDWGYENGLVLQGVRINTYACSSELNYQNSLTGIGTFCHEFSHCLGLPDLYNTKEGNSVLGISDLMDQGCYNGNSWCPVGYSSYERYACGWLTPVETDDPMSLRASVVATDGEDSSDSEIGQAPILPLQESPDARIYHLSPDANDYYLIEHREKVGWDKHFPRKGLIVWHIDYDKQAWYENTVNNDPDHLRVERMSLFDIPSGIADITVPDKTVVAVHDLQGRRLPTTSLPVGRLYIVQYSDGSVRKVFK